MGSGQSNVHAEQAALWNGSSGKAWVESQGLLDGIFKPVEDLLVAASADESPQRLLDVGCGTGGTTVAVARQLGAAVQCTGIDVSEPMIAAAELRARTAEVPVSFRLADAQRYPFEPACFDMIISRFGVMFFDDFVQAFANLHRAACDNGLLCCVAWRGAGENPFMTTAERAAAPLLPDLPARDPAAPGQFAFADEHKVRAILDASGWKQVAIRPVDCLCSFPEAQLYGFLARMGPVGRALQELDEAARQPVLVAVRAAFEPFVSGSQVRFNAALWEIRARA